MAIASSIMEGNMAWASTISRHISHLSSSSQAPLKLHLFKRLCHPIVGSTHTAIATLQLPSSLITANLLHSNSFPELQPFLVQIVSLLLCTQAVHISACNQRSGHDMYISLLNMSSLLPCCNNFKTRFFFPCISWVKLVSYEI